MEINKELEEFWSHWENPDVMADEELSQYSGSILKILKDIEAAMDKSESDLEKKEFLSRQREKLTGALEDVRDEIAKREMMPASITRLARLKAQMVEEFKKTVKMKKGK